MSEEPNNSALLRELLARLDYLEEQLHRQTARIYAIEQQVGIVRPPAPDPGPVVESAPLSKPVPERRRVVFGAIDWERLIAGNWFNRIGILAIILAVGFFLKYAFENQWLGPAGRVALGLGAGLTLLLTGELIRRRGYRFYAHGLSGGGVCLLYLSIYAAYDRYQLIGPPVALGLLVLVTALAVTLAVRYDALAIAILGLLFGFLTPVLLSNDGENQAALFGYIILLDLGVLGIAWFRHWRILNYLAWLATVLLSYAWWSDWYRPERRGATLLYLTLLFLSFAVTAVLYNIVRRTAAHELDLLLIVINSGVYYAALYQMLEADHEGWLGLSAVLLGAFHLGQGEWARRRSPDDRYLVLALRGVGVAALTVAIPVWFSLTWVTIGWAVEGLLLTWVGLKTGRWLTRYAAGGLLVLALLHWLNFDLTGLAPADHDHFWPLLNRRGLPLLTVILALVGGARLYRHFADQPALELAERERRNWTGGQLLLAALLLIGWVTVDHWDYFRLLAVPYREAGDGQRELDRLQDWGNLLLGLWWSLSGLGLLRAGLRWQAPLARALGLLFFLLAGLLWLISGARFHAADWHVAILNPTLGMGVGIALLLGLGYREYQRSGEVRGPFERRVMTRSLLTLANLTLLSSLSLEVDGFFARQNGLGDSGLIEQLSQSILSATYGGILIGAGIWRGRRQIRLLGLVTLALTTIKVFLVDLAALDQIYRVISFIVLGVILLVVSWHYQKRSESDRA